MSSLTVRNVDKALKQALRMRAARRGHSMEEEVRSILREAVLAPEPQGGMGSRLVKRFRSVATALSLPPRNPPREPPRFGRRR
jgi:plasmid stability protein